MSGSDSSADFSSSSSCIVVASSGRRMCISRQDLEESRQSRDGHTMDRRPAGLEGRLLLRIEGIKRAPVLRLSEIRADEAIADHGRSNYICTESDSNLQITSVGTVQIEAVRHLAIGRVGTYSANSHGAVNHVFLPSFSKRASSVLYMSTMGSPSSGTGLLPISLLGFIPIKPNSLTRVAGPCPSGISVG